jgi:hypothetical protein
MLNVCMVFPVCVKLFSLAAAVLSDAASIPNSAGECDKHTFQEELLGPLRKLNCSRVLHYETSCI